MKTAIGILSAGMLFFYIGQLISVVDFPLAQRLGLQESADEADALFARSWGHGRRLSAWSGCSPSPAS